MWEYEEKRRRQMRAKWIVAAFGVVAFYIFNLFVGHYFFRAPVYAVHYKDVSGKLQTYACYDCKPDDNTTVLSFNDLNSGKPVTISGKYDLKVISYMTGAQVSKKYDK